MTIPELGWPRRTERLELRLPTDEAIDEVLRWRNHPDVTRWLLRTTVDPDSFRKACFRFFETEILRPNVPDKPKPVARQGERGVKTPPVAVVSRGAQSRREIPTEFILSALEKSVDDSGWAHLGRFGSYLTQLQPDFDSRLYGFSQLSKLVKARTDLFEVEERPVQGSKHAVLYLRAR